MFRTLISLIFIFSSSFANAAALVDYIKQFTAPCTILETPVSQQEALVGRIQGYLVQGFELSAVTKVDGPLLNTCVYSFSRIR